LSAIHVVIQPKYLISVGDSCCYPAYKKTFHLSAILDVTQLIKRPPISSYSLRDLAFKKTFPLSAIPVVTQHAKRPHIFGDFCRDPAYQKTFSLSAILVVTKLTKKPPL
jgi:hypothetical protein